MNRYKLHFLPLFILITGFITLTAGCKKKDMSLKLIVGDMDKLVFHLFGSIPVFWRADADGLCHS